MGWWLNQCVLVRSQISTQISDLYRTCMYDSCRWLVLWAAGCEGERNVPVHCLALPFDFWAGQASLDKKLVIVSKNLNFGVTLYWRSGSAFVSEWSPSCGSFQREGTHRKCERSPVRIGHRVFCFCLSSSFGVGHRGFVVASGWRVEREEKMGDPYVRTISTWSYVRNVNLSEKMPAIACMAAVRKFIVLYWIRDSMY